MLLPKTYYDKVRKEIRTELVGLRIMAPNVGGTPVFSSAQDELQILTGTPVTTNTVDLGIDFPMAGTTVRELTINGSQTTDFYFTDFPLIGFNFNKSRGDVYQAVIGDEVSKRQAILQFNNIHQNWEEGTLQFIFFEETGEIQAQFEKHQPSNGESVGMREIIDWSTTIGQSSYLNSGDTMRFLPQRAKFVLNRGGPYIPVVLQSASAPEAPILQTPAFGTTFEADTPEVTFTWDNPNEEDAYKTLFLAATDPTFHNIVARVELTGVETYTMDTSRLLTGAPYYWKVVVVDTDERVFSYSANGAFSLVEEQEIDSTPPEVEFNINGRTTAAKTADSTVTVTDTESGVDGDSLRYVWTQSTIVPDSGWEPFTSGQIVSQSTGDGSWYLHVQASDQAGNRIDAVSNTFVLDNTAPTVSVSSSASNTVNDAFPITITFNESVTGLTEDDLVVINGTASDFASVDAATYTATITPETSGQDVSVSIAAGAATDTAGNDSTASNTLTKRYDTTKPVLAFGGFTDQETFHTPPAEVSVVVSEAVYWLEDGAELDADNALSLISMTKDGDDFSGYTPTYDESSRTYVLTFNDVLEDGLYDIAVAGDVVANENGNTLDGARASFVVAIPVVTSMSASPISLPSAGGNSTVTMIGDNLTGQMVKVYVDGVEAVTATVDSNTSAWATLSLPANQTYAAKNYRVTVDLNGEAVAGVSSMVEVGAASSPPPSPTYILSANADLAKLEVYAMNQGLELSPVFTPGTTSYSVQTDADQVRLQLSADHPYAVVKLAGERVDKSATVPLALGSNKLEITVQAENGTIKTYTVTIERIAGNEPVEPVEPPVTPIPVCSFTDIEGHWAQSELCEAAELGIVEGVDALTFRPNGEVTRAEFTAMLLRTLHIPIDYESQELTFSDKNSVPEWALPTIQTAVEQGVIQGYTDGTLRPQQTVSRTEMAALVSRAMAWGTDSLASTPFADDARIPDWAKAYVEAARMHGLLEGREGNRFVPDGQTTRAEAAVVLLRLRHAIH